MAVTEDAFWCSPGVNRRTQQRGVIPPVGYPQRTPRSSLARPLLDSSAPGDRERHGEGAPAVAPSARRRTKTVSGRPDRRQSTVEPRCGSGVAVPAGLVGWSEPGNQAKAVTPRERPEGAPTGGDHHRARLGVRQGPPLHVLAQARRPPSVHPSDLRLALPGLPDPRGGRSTATAICSIGARHRAAGGGASSAVAGQGDDEGRHRPRPAGHDDDGWGALPRGAAGLAPERPQFVR